MEKKLKAHEKTVQAKDKQISEYLKELASLKLEQNQRTAQNSEFFERYKTTLQQLHDQVRGLGNNVINCERAKEQQYKKAKKDMKQKIRMIRAQTVADSKSKIREAEKGFKDAN